MTIEELKAGLPEDPVADDYETGRVRWLIGEVERLQANVGIARIQVARELLEFFASNRNPFESQLAALREKYGLTAQPAEPTPEITPRRTVPYTSSDVDGWMKYGKDGV